ncbi:RecB family exonuclease [Rhodococcus sp. BP-349]|nr:RecB family exonuclease [Rhodococcus sp. BP-363]MBY6544721.1 RecB family exonuclease [Rhodococcus sp. BP-369]MBY6563951.1 RecB family exonuclease [Rhodococcus sp. BP-370]MBY6579112.1 RecB family exonuclease [Rhodococcus sp. BP-364]MBY6588413.1 RecB family exonuclease [Rhodococcus sp. BP-358]MBY6592750.1 RecB family exonuclease [Rhodococcus sp. BP-362]MBY6596218.1 RecB family exonuclease [Rhodococcus sp. BP-359]MBY6600557.1 RecB family exonuclease [Rhodococcus sp. BP-353]MBY6605763.1 RecB
MSTEDPVVTDVAAAAPSAEPGRPRRRPALSPSRAADYKQCPLLYRFRAIDRLPAPPSRAQLRGTLVHSALESLYALPAADRVSTRAGTLVQEEWDAMVVSHEYAADLVEEHEREQFVAEAQSLVASYYSLEDPTRFDPESCEQLVETELDDGVLLRGYIDRIDVAPTGQLRVVDYKTGKAPREIAEAKALFQMKFYAVVLMRTRGIVPAQLRLLFLKDSQILTYAPDEDELRRFERTLSAIWTAIRSAGETGDFRPKPGKLCGWCDFQALCPSFGGTPPEYPGWPGEPTEVTA